MKKRDLFDMLVRPKQHFIIGDYVGYVIGIALEDGSGKCFNVTVRLKQSGKIITTFIRTID